MKNGPKLYHLDGILDVHSDNEEMLTPGTWDESTGEHQEDAEIPEQGVNWPEEEEKLGTSEGLSGKQSNEHLAEEEKVAAARGLRYPVRSAK